MTGSRLDGMVAVVTGGGRGIGQAIALALAREGADVALASRSKDELAAVADEIRNLGRDALPVATDLRVAEEVADLGREVIDHFGRVDVLVNNSGVAGPIEPLWKIEPGDWDDTFAVNVRGVYLGCQAFLPAMIERRSGSIICIGSMTGKAPLVHRTPYAASKTALIGLVRTLAHEVGEYGIRVNLISPGPVRGERLLAILRRRAEERGVPVDEEADAFAARAPLRRLVEPDDVAAAAVFLASAEAAAITGEDLNVSSGLVMY